MPTPSYQDIDRAVSLYAEGRTLQEIGDQLGWPAATISWNLRQRGVKVRRISRTTAPNRQTSEYDDEGRLVRKWCPGCESMQDAANWWANARNADGLQSECRDCHSARKAAGRRAGA